LGSKKSILQVGYENGKINIFIATEVSWRILSLIYGCKQELFSQRGSKHYSEVNKIPELRVGSLEKQRRALESRLMKGKGKGIGVDRLQWLASRARGNSSRALTNAQLSRCNDFQREK